MKKYLHRKYCAIGIIFFFICAYINPALAQDTDKSSLPTSRGNWLFVGGSGPGNYTNIQDAIDNASDGDTVFVFNGTYLGYVIINKSINLLGEDKNTTIINGFVAFTISIVSDWVNFSGFTIKNGQRLGEGVRIDSCFNNFINNIVDIPNDNMRIAGDNNAISNNTITGDSIYLSGDSNIISGNTITNNEYGIYSTDSYDNIISNNSFFNCGLYISYETVWNYTVTDNTVNGKPLVYLFNESDLVLGVCAGQIILVNCTNITVQNQVIFNTTVGIQILGSNACVISDNNIEGNHYGICLYGWNNTINDNIIAKNNFEGIYLFGDSNSIFGNIISENEDGIYLFYSNYNNIINNTITLNVWGILQDYGCNFNNFTNNTITFSYDAMHLSGDCNTISGNTVTSNENGISLFEVSNTISSNTIIDNYYGITVNDDANNNNIINNFIANNRYRGITLYSDSNTISGNFIKNSGCSGIYGGVYNTIFNNNFTNNDYGIRLVWGSSYNNFINNTITDNNYGIGLNYSCNYNNVNNNSFTNNDYGINLDDNSSNNKIYHNNFINNTINALDCGNNTWDDGKKGNYWDDYKEKYPDAHKLLRKGIWDTPYDIPGGINKDNFPLIKPFNKPRNKIFNTPFQNIIKYYMNIFILLQIILNRLKQ